MAVSENRVGLNIFLSLFDQAQADIGVQLDVEIDGYRLSWSFELDGWRTGHGQAQA